MRRLEYARRIRGATGRARNAAEAVMFLANIARERHRLDQERKTLEGRIRRIEARLTAISATETKLVPRLRFDVPPAAAAPAAPPPTTPRSAAAMMTLQY